MALPLISDEIVIDGHINENIWDKIEPLPLAAYTPVAGLSPSEKTEIRFAYDANYLYASIRAFDSEPSAVRANTLYRDRYSGDDHIHILLDTFNDNESGMVFVVTPTGAKRDQLVSNDGEGSNAINTDFNTYWEAAAQVDERGWYAEIRIPFTSLGFQDENGRVTMGLYVQRGITRKNERVTFPEVPDHLTRAYYRPSLAKKIILDSVYSQQSLHFTPYFTGGLEQKNVLNDAATDFSSHNNHKLEPGFDLKYGISNNINLDVTVNTDFAQVEADDEQADLTRFNIFFPEKRQFFLEKSGLFEFNTEGSGRLFHSRRIGLTEKGESVRILGGGRLYGRIGSWDVGLLNMQTDKHQELPGTNYGVVRFRRRIVNPYSYAGAMFTSKVTANGSDNLSFGMDGSIRLKANDYLVWTWAQTIDENINDLLFWDASQVRINWERRTRRGFSWKSTINRTGDKYNPGIGFVPRSDYFHIGQEINYGWMPGENSPLHWHSLKLDGSVYWRTTEPEIESAEYGAFWNGDTKNGDQISTGLTWHYEDILTDFTILDRARIFPGEYSFFRAEAGYRRAAGRLFRPGIDANIGSFYDGWRLLLNFSPRWNLSKHFELEASWLYNLVDLPSEPRRFDAHIGQLRVRTALNTQLSTNALFQVNSSANRILTNIRFRYNFRDGNDLWIVYNEGIHTNRHRSGLVWPRMDTRVLMAKYTHTFHGSN
ncbi:MAG: DUF5916 domain-containing protein [Balneolaceae bacterium]